MAIAASVIAAGLAFAKMAWASFLALLTGGKPRGDLQKFQRTIYGPMAGQAQLTGFNTYAYWFDDIVEVRPDGGFQVVAVPGNVATAMIVYNQWTAEGKKFWDIRCGASVDFDNPSDIAEGCTFIGHNITNSDQPPGSGTQPGNGGGFGGFFDDPLQAGVGLLGLALVAVWILFPPGKGK